MEQDGAESVLVGEVASAAAAGVIRYRLWPARRYPVRSALVALGVIVCVAATWVTFHAWLWATVVFVGCVTGAAVMFFPTEVTLDGHQLNMRALATLRTWDLRRFRRMSLEGGVLPRVELTRRAKLTPIDRVRSVVLPLPRGSEDATRVVDHLRRWVGKVVTGKFEIDEDQVPEDVVEDS